MKNESSINSEQLYWTCQALGWSTYMAIMWILNQLEGREIDFYFVSSLIITNILGILISHTYRELIIQLHWLSLKIAALIPRVILTSILCGVAYFFLHTFLFEIVVARQSVILTPIEILRNTLDLSVIFILWSLAYFLFHFVQNYRKEEIKNLRWQALSNEVELNKLKSQLNPHFIFNSMNSIRALVDEDPEKSKDSITQLSNILRSSLLMGRQKVIPLRQELQLVNDYLSLEQTRFEERLKVNFHISESAMEHQIPPMMLQTLVENGIKHGISQLPEGGEITISASKDKGLLTLHIENSGKLVMKKGKEQGFGLLNTQQRLFLLYGDKGKITLTNTTHETVLTEVVIPDEVKEIELLKTEKL